MRTFYKALGHYLPSFFFINLNTNESIVNIDLTKLSTQSTFFHEYIHFIQDITTTFGLSNIIKTVDILKTISRTIHSNGQKQIKIPFGLTDDNNININKDLSSIYNGEFEIPNNFSTLIKCELKENLLVQDFESVKYVELKYFDNQKLECFNVHFGGNGLMESHANIIQTKLFGHNNSPNYPYKIAEIICNFYYPELSKNLLNIFAICDISLNVFNSGEFFINFILNLKKAKINPKNPKDIYDFAENLEFKYSNEIYTLKQLFEVNSKIAEKSVIDYFTNDYFNPLKEWIRLTFSKLRDSKLSNFSFLLENISNNESINIAKFIEIVNEIGVPLISNNNDEFATLQDINGAFHLFPAFKVISEIYEILVIGSKKNCQLVNFCNKSKEGDFTNEYCNISPWKRINDKKLCYFAHIWKMWGLHDDVIFL